MAVRHTHGRDSTKAGDTQGTLDATKHPVAAEASKADRARAHLNMGTSTPAKGSGSETLKNRLIRIWKFLVEPSDGGKDDGGCSQTDPGIGDKENPPTPRRTATSTTTSNLGDEETSWVARRTTIGATISNDMALLLVTNRDMYGAAYGTMLALQSGGKTEYDSTVRNIPNHLLMENGQPTDLSEVLSNMLTFFLTDEEGFREYARMYHPPDFHTRNTRDHLVSVNREGRAKGSDDHYRETIIKGMAFLHWNDRKAFDIVFDAMSTLHRDGKEAFDAKVGEILRDERAIAKNDTLAKRLGINETSSSGGNGFRHLFDSMSNAFVSDQARFAGMLSAVSCIKDSP
ncbi:MAG: hypothetical protein OXF02_02390 [Simkaniaceae bacterium]|nr:hypothetical protein [Simkaniaceae bacterium]